MENALVLSPLNDEIFQRCDKEVIDENLLDVPVDVMVEEWQLILFQIMRILSLGALHMNPILYQVRLLLN